MKMFRKAIALLLALLSLSVCVASAEDFSLRGGIRFGMTPEEVIAIEASNGFHYDLTNSGDTLYRHTTGYQLYFEDKNIGSLGTMPIMRFEYDFTLASRQMYQFYYVFRTDGAYAYLQPALVQKYGAPTTANTLSTEKYREIGASSHLNHSHWELEYGEEIIVIDIWDNSYGVCFLSYQAFDAGSMQDEQNSLNFGL